MEAAVDTTIEQDKPFHQGTINIKPFEFAPGQSGNPKGRPVGSRTKLAEDFLKDIYEDWKLHGADAIIKVRKKKPEIYLRIVADLIPKDIKLDIPQLNRIAHVIVDMPNAISTLGDDEPIDLLPIDTQLIDMMYIKPIGPHQPIDTKPVTESNR